MHFWRPRKKPVNVIVDVGFLSRLKERMALDARLAAYAWLRRTSSKEDAMPSIRVRLKTEILRRLDADLKKRYSHRVVVIRAPFKKRA
jgi:hypothetical protein